MVCAFGDPGQTVGRSALTSLLLPSRYLELGVPTGNTADRCKGLSGCRLLSIAILYSTFPCQRARHDAPIVIGGVTSGAYRLTCTGASFVLVKIAPRRIRLVCSHAVVSSATNTASSVGLSVLILLVRLRVVLTVALSPSTHMNASLPSPTHIPSCFSIPF